MYQSSEKFWTILNGRGGFPDHKKEGVAAGTRFLVLLRPRRRRVFLRAGKERDGIVVVMGRLTAAYREKSPKL
jgi:hypothetical protein